MCGIAGVHFKNGRFIASQSQLEKVTDRLLLGIESRGKDAAGFVATTRDGKKLIHNRMSCRASWYIVERPAVPAYTKTILLHTRFATQGSPAVADNNHPVKYGNTFVVHNGHINNDDELFKEHELKRNAQVDSEVIAALINKFGFDKIHQALQQLDGGFAIAAINPRKNPNELILAKGPNSPLHVYEDSNLIMWASERKPVEDGLETLGVKVSWADIHSLAEGDLLWVHDREVESLEFMTKDMRERAAKRAAAEEERKEREHQHNKSFGRWVVSSDGKTESYGCKGCNHAITDHPKTSEAEEGKRCMGKTRRGGECHCRAWVGPYRSQRPAASADLVPGASCSLVDADENEVVCHIGIDGERYGVTRGGKLVDMVTGESVEWPADGYDTPQRCVRTGCWHSEFSHAGMVGRCDMPNCKCGAAVFSFQHTKNDDKQDEDEGGEGDADLQCEGCNIWVPESEISVLETWDLCQTCYDELVSDDNGPWSKKAEAKERDDQSEWEMVAVAEASKHRWCIGEVKGETGYAPHFIEWLLFRAPLELLEEDEWLCKARKEMDEAYADAEDVYEASNTH